MGIRVRGGGGACVLAVLLVAVAACDLPPLCAWREALQDLVLGLAAPARAESGCLVVAADGRSRREVGPWPWPASVAGRLVERIARGNPRAIGIVPCPASSDGGRSLIEAVRRAGNVACGFTFSFMPASYAGGPPAPQNARIRYVTNPWGAVQETGVPAADGTECVDAPLAEASAVSGFSNLPRGGETAVRALPLVCAEQRGHYKGLALALAAVALKADRVTLRLKGGAVDGVDLGGLRVPTDGSGMLRLFPSRGGRGPEIVSASDVLFGHAEAARWEGKVVIVGECGAPAPARTRGRLPNSSPAAILNAEAVDALLGGRYLRRPRLAALLELALVCAFPFVARGVFSRGGRARPPSVRRAWLRWGLLAVALAAMGAAGVAFAAGGEEVRPFYPALSAVVSWAAFGALRGREPRVS